MAQQQLRWFRTSLLGRIPAWTPPIAPVGPWRPITLERASPIAAHDLKTRLEGRDGVVEATIALRGDVKTVELAVGEHRATLEVDGVARGTLRVPNAPLWWPHTHGAQPLLPVRARVDGADFELGATGFRKLDVDQQGGAFTLHVNGVRVFARGACWTPLDPIGLGATKAELRAALTQVKRAGMNMVRLSGTMVYESRDFHELCDELGILVWQDFMFANMDYPIADERFAASVRREATQAMSRLQLSPSLVVCCGGSEVEQQAAMMGLPEKDWSSPLFAEVLPGIVREARPDVAYVRSTPASHLGGGVLPFHVDRGVSHYYGVGAYLRDFDDARRARVRFTSECLAFANVPRDETIEALMRDGESPPNHPRWKSRVPRDRGTPWDFDDVRDHYVKEIFGVDPRALLFGDGARYLELGRVATGEAMAAAMSEWRRAGSECAGALVWFLRDLWDGAGWGVIDARGAPKAAYHHLKRVLAPVALLAIDEGLNGLALHAVNDAPSAIDAELRVALHRGEGIVAEGTRAVALGAHDAIAVSADEVIGRFTDVTYAYRFGPRGHDATLATLRDRASGALLGRAFHFPRGARAERASDLGLEARAERVDEGSWRLTVRTKKVAYAVAIDARGFVADDDFFHVAPGDTGAFSTVLTGRGDTISGTVKALNATTPTKIVCAR